MPARCFTNARDANNCFSLKLVIVVCFVLSEPFRALQFSKGTKEIENFINLINHCRREAYKVIKI